MARATWILYGARILENPAEKVAAILAVCVNVCVCDLIKVRFGGDPQTKSDV